MDFNSAPVSISAGDFFQMKQQIDNLGAENVALKNRVGILESENFMLSTSYSRLQNEVAAQVRARVTSDRKVAALTSSLAEALEEQQRLRATSMRIEPVGTSTMSNPASVPLRIISVGSSRTEMAVDGELGSLVLANATDEHANASGPSPDPASPKRYPDEIPEKDRNAIRTRMLQDRGPNVSPPAASRQLRLEEASLGAPAPAAISGGTTPASSTRGSDEAPRYPSLPAADVSGPLGDGEISVMCVFGCVFLKCC